MMIGWNEIETIKTAKLGLEYVLDAVWLMNAKY